MTNKPAAGDIMPLLGELIRQLDQEDRTEASNVLRHAQILILRQVAQITMLQGDVEVWRAEARELAKRTKP